MRRLAAVAVSLVALASGCSASDDTSELRELVRTSSVEERSFSYEVGSERSSFRVEGFIEDEFRYSMVLYSGGNGLVEFVVHDDVLAVRLADPGLADEVAGELGHPDVDTALRAGQWVADPSGAPPLAARTIDVEEEMDPFQEARAALRLLEGYIGGSSGAKRFSLEDIEYRPLRDPWRYPIEEDDEVRYDLIRPFLPTSEAQVSGEGDASVSQFRKVAVFTQGDRITEVCEMVDILGHEEFVALAERGPESNPFLAALFARILVGETTDLIEHRISHVRLTYESGDGVAVPQDAVAGTLEGFVSAFARAVSEGLLTSDEGLAGPSGCLRLDS